MRRYACVLLITGSAVVSAQSQAPPAPAVYKSAAAVAADLEKAGAVSRTGASSSVLVDPRTSIVVRRRTASDLPQNAIIHPLSTEVYQILKGSATLVTGGVLDPPPGQQSPLPVAADLVTSTGIKGGVVQRVSDGDVVVVPAGTPHWFSVIDGSLTYLEARFQQRQ